MGAINAESFPIPNLLENWYGGENSLVFQHVLEKNISVISTCSLLIPAYSLKASLRGKTRHRLPLLEQHQSMVRNDALYELLLF